MPANRMYQLPLQSGDTGIQALASITLSASSGTAGNLWALIMKPVATIPLPLVNVGSVQDFAALGLPLIDDESCLAYIHQATTTSSGIILGTFDVVQD
jgi:phage tail sheath gpL-like